MEIVSQLRPPGTPLCDGVCVRRSLALLDIVRTMISLTDLTRSFWGYALETTTFTLNRAPSKSVEMTPYELWFGRNLRCRFLEFGNATLMSSKLEPKAEKCIFIGYHKEIVGYTFYLRSEGKVFVARNR